ncbi:RNA methyltransferase, TrmH family [Granulicella rosea]|uniref:RNA methyltransferase, TrmH family n=1 Tax=Granulicella rosea TaxID=474952 RepID=A0A239IVG3_9BACT|nr:RNA methyltransferase [Granulicella rosea]SNS97505.1 RNA methyltransferase, TrmH family [Granulicella rosea]
MPAPTYVITSRANPSVKQLRAAFAGQARLSGGLVAIEGDHLVLEALQSGMVLKTVFISERRPVPDEVPKSVEVLRLANDVFRSCVETQSPQGIAALLVPPVGSVEKMLRNTPLILVAQALQDPGNLGTLVRSAEAFGATGVLTTLGGVSPWNQKCIRASAGSVFRLPVAQADEAAVALLKSHKVQFLAAMPTNAIPIEQADLKLPTALLIGNEGAGLDAEWTALADRRITIPTPGRVESLNAAVAGSLLLYEASRQRASR